MSRSPCSPAGKQLRWPRGCSARPSIEIVARDRAGAYSEAVDIALPAARASPRSPSISLRHPARPTSRGCCTDSDRNCAKQPRRQVEVGGVTLGRQEVLEPHLDSGHGSATRRSATRHAAGAVRAGDGARQRRGGTMKGIGRELSINHRTVRKFVTAGAFPERAAGGAGSDAFGSPSRLLY
ncbi:hypothetical protein ACU4GD_14650 [Cupriavidus basilensis]